MLNIELSLHETRVLGCLLEKAVTTPDQYPLTLNALVNACNQKSSRDPVLNLDPGEVERTVRNLQAKHLVTSKENFKSRVEKHTHRFCNTPFADFQLDSAQYAIVCLLLLRGAQTPGELRSRSGRLHQFADNSAATAALQSLIDYEGGPLVARLPRQAGRQDHEYVHLFSGEVESVAAAVEPVTASVSVESDSLAPPALEARVVALEQAIAELRAEVRDLGNRE